MRVTLLALLCLAWFAVPAVAACRVATRAVEFGEVDLARDSHGTGRLTVTCDASTGFRVGIEGGDGSLFMDGPGQARLTYRLYSDPGHRVPFDEEGVAAATDGEQPAQVTVYGRVPRQSALPEGVYAGRLVVTLAF
ncbi:spore coat protein U domain-containing protein [Geminicoccaceae bacterium 1502E]|nr:spore coat protein U domain-containing protein [Geminicoccaceae bacterium 1502E]